MMAEINFVIFKINGTDISQLPEEKVVEMFLTAGDSLLIEMHRSPSNICEDANAKLADLRIAPSIKPQTGASARIADVDLTSTIKLVVAIKSSELATNADNRFADSCKSTQTDSSYYIYDNPKETADHFIEHEHNLQEQCLPPEIDIEEITLRKSDSNERLGLIVCYNGCVNNGNCSENNGALSSSDDNDTCTEVYISGIQPNSVACRDGRLRQGDQILQINGKDIKNKEETELLIAENNNAVTLLVSRYLFTDEVDFNDPLLAHLEVEDEDDIEDEEFYVESNITYENCLQNEPANELVKALALHSDSKAKKPEATRIENKPSVTINFTNADAVLPTSNTIQACVEIGSPLQKSTFGSSLSKDFTSAAISEKCLNQLTSQFASQQNIRKMHQYLVKKSFRSYKTDQPSWTLPTPFGSLRSHINEQRHINYDAEHIYETIPEDSESEPFYCSPYESSTYVTTLGSCSSTGTDLLQLQQQKRNVAKWLDVCPNPMAMPHNVKNAVSVTKDYIRSNSGSIRKQLQSDSFGAVIRKKNNSVRSTLTTITNGSNSSGGSGNSGTSNIVDVSQSEERDYSSSVYNTGGSNNSTIPLITVVNQSIKCSAILENSKVQKQQLSKENPSCVLSKTGCDGIPQFSQNLRNPIDGASAVRASPQLKVTLEDPYKFSTNHLYYNDFIQSRSNQKNMSREINSKKKLRPVLTQDQLTPHQNLCCPQFIAPNLSQYHFVSSQEVRTGMRQTTAVPPRVDSTITHKTLSKEETMVWKVKRRQDGTRYIVRRPARNRCLLRDRSIRINTEQVRNRDISTTTEEDNISEAKTGRYWSKEERRKHIERARERKQQHLQMIDDTNVSKAFARDQSSLKLCQQKGLILQQRPHQHRFTEHSGTQIKQGNIDVPLQQHYQLQFNSSRMQQHQKQTRILGGCDSNGTNCGSSSTKEPVLETNEIDPCKISAPLIEITPIIKKSSCDGFPSSLLVPGSQSASAASTFPVSADGSELQNFISITTI